MTTEVTREEMQREFQIVCTKTAPTGFVKHLTITDRDGIVYGCRLYWDEHDGYGIYWDNGIPPMSERPEFEYILDSITEDSNANNR